MACELFGFGDNDLIGLHLNDLITMKSRSEITVGESHLGDDGEVVEVSGKVVSFKNTVYYV